MVAFRLQDEYAVPCVFDTIDVYTARWIYCDDEKHLEEFRTKAYDHLALDHAGALVYLAPSRVNLELTIERWPKISFRATREAQSRLGSSGLTATSENAAEAAASVSVPAHGR